MNQGRWIIQIYVDEAGNCPFDDWFDALDTPTKARVETCLDQARIFK
jgi:hypothetical protein